MPAVRYIVMLVLYDGLTIVIVAVFMMKGPKEIWASKRAADKHLRRRSEPRGDEHDLAHDDVLHGALFGGGVQHDW